MRIPAPSPASGIGPDRAPMGDVAKEPHPLAHDVVARVVADVDDETDTARIVLDTQGRRVLVAGGSDTWRVPACSFLGY